MFCTEEAAVFAPVYFWTRVRRGCSLLLVPNDYRLALPDEGVGGEAGGRMSPQQIEAQHRPKSNVARWTIQRRA